MSNSNAGPRLDSRHHEYFIDLHRWRRRHPSFSEVYDSFGDDIWMTFKNDLFKGMFCDHVRKNRYPIPQEIINKSPYMRRSKKENDLLKQIKNKKNIILVGCEGSGKSTTCHYVFGHLLNKQQCTRVIYMDASDYPEFDDFGRLFYRDLVREINYLLHRENKEDKFRSLTDKISKTSIGFKNLLNIDNDEGYVTTFFTLLSYIIPDQHVYLFIDNMDSLSRKTSEGLTSTVSKMLKDVEILHGDISQQSNFIKKKPCIGISFIITLRTPTFSDLTSHSKGLFPFSGGVEIDLEDDLRDRVDVWSLVERYLFVEKKAQTEQKLLEHGEFTIPLDFRSSYTVVDLASFFRAQIGWLREHFPSSNKIIKNFCGRSIRRYKMYGLKTLGHLAVCRLHVLETKKSERISRNLRNSILLDALYDFRQPIGSRSGRNYGEFHLNPFGVIEDRQLRKKNPLIGIQSLWLIYKTYEKQTKKFTYAHKYDAESLVDRLKLIGYQNEAIRQVFRAFWLSGLLRPCRTSEVLVEGNDEADCVHKECIIDPVALNTYYRLIFVDDEKKIEESIFFINNATRYNYAVDYHSSEHLPIYNCYTNLIFLYDIFMQERNLKNKISGVTLTEPVESYFFHVRIRLIRHWKMLINSRQINRSKLNNETAEMLAKALDLMSYIEQLATGVDERFLNAA